MKLDAFIEGLQILQKHYAKPDGYHIGAEHDQFYAYATTTPLEPQEVERMLDLGWFQPDAEYDHGDEMKPSDYDATEGWSAFT